MVFKSNNEFRELIDTLWNVNEIVAAVNKICNLRINRYIMECKFTRGDV